MPCGRVVLHEDHQVGSNMKSCPCEAVMRNVERRVFLTWGMRRRQVQRCAPTPSERFNGCFTAKSGGAVMMTQKNQMTQMTPNALTLWHSCIPSHSDIINLTSSTGDDPKSSCNMVHIANDLPASLSCLPHQSRKNDEAEQVDGFAGIDVHPLRSFPLPTA